MSSRINNKQVSVSTVSQSGPIKLDLSKFRGGVGIIVTIPVGTTATYSVLVTGDDPTVGFTNWNNHDVLNSKTVSANSNLAFPVTGVALNVTAISGGGAVVMSVVQVDG